LLSRIFSTRPAVAGLTVHAQEISRDGVHTVLTLADAIDPTLRALVLMAGFVGLRPEEMLALTRADIDLTRRVVRITETVQEINGLGRVEGPPKSEAGRRTLAIPRLVADALEWQMARFVGPSLEAVVFVGRRGEPLPRGVMYRGWHEARAKVPDAPAGLRIYDLRHHAATLIARKPGVTTKELMAHIGHSSFRAALIYQHASEERNREIADFIDGHVAANRTEPR
jgi:integrase